MQLSLGKLLTKVNGTRNWSEEQVIELAKPMGINKAEASRFYNALVEMNLLTFDKLRQRYVANFNVVIWSNEDAKLGLIKDLMEIYPIRLPRGIRKSQPIQVVTIQSFSAQELVAELRNRGYEVKATKTITTVEEL